MEDSGVKVEDEPSISQCSTSSGRSSPDSSCPICLSKLDNKSFTDSCFHQFCFACLLEWSNVKAECPLCKQTFKAIIYNIRSMQDYDQYELPPRHPTNFQMPHPWQDAFTARPSFRYRTTSQVSTYLEYVVRLDRALNDHVLPSLPEIPRSPYLRRLPVGTESFRRNIYQQGLWVQQLPDFTGRTRESSPEFYRANPALTHRLMPWLNRELNVLCGSDTPTVMSRIMELITQVPIRSRGFSSAVGSYLGRHLDHFVHEFYNFATTPYDMVGWDRHANYVNRSSLAHLRVTDSDDSDVQVLETIDVRAPPIQLGSDSDDCVVVDGIVPPNQHTPEVITIESEEEVVQVNININSEAGPSRQPLPNRRRGRRIKKEPSQQVNVSININHAGPSHSRTRHLSSSSNEDWSPRHHRVKRKKRTLKTKKSKCRKSKHLLQSSEEEDNVQPKQPPAPTKKRSRKLSSSDDDDSNVLRIDTDLSLSADTSSEEERCRNTGQALSTDVQVSAETQEPEHQQQQQRRSTNESSDSSDSGYRGPSRGARRYSSTTNQTK